ncbi:MAG: hypothetical protein IAE96_06010 [Chitinophagaceae bacterium]|nr:hypothetical protein [Chitinophagaceae bacterium]
MERIASLIHKLKEQADQHASPAQLLATVQLIQFELTKAGSASGQGLGTAKVAVMLPAVPAAPVSRETAVVPEQYEKYIPAPANPVTEPITPEKPLKTAEAPAAKARNTQLDMTFDPLTEIPTLFHQAPKKEVNDKGDNGESLNDKLKQGHTELMEVLKEAPVRDLRKAIGINDRFLFINELFRGDENMYDRCIRTINNFTVYAEAEYWISRELKVKLGWDPNNEAVLHFDQLVKRRFS